MGLWHDPRWDSFKLAVRGRIHAHNLLLTCWTPVVQIRERLFDLWNGIDTAGRQPFDDLTLRGSDGSDAGGYGPVRPRDFRRALSSLEIDHRQYCFVDFGSGKGRAILMASRYPFKKIIGIEFAKELHEAALINLRSWRWRKSAAPLNYYGLTLWNSTFLKSRASCSLPIPLARLDCEESSRRPCGQSRIIPAALSLFISKAPMNPSSNLFGM